MRTTAGLNFQAATRGFTLIELLLTVVLLLLLAGAIVVNFPAMQGAAQLDEAAEQMESAIRFSRAYAANSGCKVRLRFEEKAEEGNAVPMGNVFVEWESDPVHKPGVYEPLREVATLVESMLDAAQIEDVRSLDAPSSPTTSPGVGEMEEGEMSFAPITFFPDGSSDSAEIILASRSEGEGRRISITIVGATGVVRKAPVIEFDSNDEEWMNEFSEK
jgi:prepilin-type N-terminal cleavage/methylation domain-containing protein